MGAGRGIRLPGRGFVISYARARAESVGLDCKVGIAERTERLLILLVPAFFYGLRVPYLLPSGPFRPCDTGADHRVAEIRTRLPSGHGMNIQDEVTFGPRDRVAHRQGSAREAGLRSVRPIRRSGVAAAWQGVVQLEKNLQKVLPDATDAQIREVLAEGMRPVLV